jgi:hypothetical protein
MALLLTRIRVDDYDAWKPRFDSDPAGAREAAKGHRISRSVENPNEVFVQVEFASSEEAKAARERLLSSGVLDQVMVESEPTVTEVAESVAY